jgi:hypothetical protein
MKTNSIPKLFVSLCFGVWFKLLAVAKRKRKFGLFCSAFTGWMARLIDKAIVKAMNNRAIIWLHRFLRWN